jgi:hypothetical protein
MIAVEDAVGSILNFHHCYKKINSLGYATVRPITVAAWSKA